MTARRRTCPYPEEHTGPGSEPAYRNNQTSNQTSACSSKNPKTNDNKLARSVKALSLVGCGRVEGGRKRGNTVERHPCFMIQMRIFCILSPLPPSILHALIKAQNRLHTGEKEESNPYILNYIVYLILANQYRLPVFLVSQSESCCTGTCIVKSIYSWDCRLYPFYAYSSTIISSGKCLQQFILVLQCQVYNIK